MLCDAEYVQNWNRLGSYTANAFSLCTLSQIISKWLISCCMCYSLTKYRKIHSTENKLHLSCLSNSGRFGPVIDQVNILMCVLMFLQYQPNGKRQRLLHFRNLVVLNWSQTTDLYLY